MVRQGAAAKQREAEARLLGQREALRMQRAAELVDAEAQARMRAVEFEGPVMRALMQDKVSTHTTRYWVRQHMSKQLLRAAEHVLALAMCRYSAMQALHM